MPVNSIIQAAEGFGLARGIDAVAWVPTCHLYRGDPYSGGLEVSALEYVPQPLIWSNPDDSDDGRQVFNLTAIIYANPVTNWGTLTHGVVRAGLIIRLASLLAGTLSERTILAGSPPVTFAVGDIIWRKP